MGMLAGSLFSDRRPTADTAREIVSGLERLLPGPVFLHSSGSVVMCQTGGNLWLEDPDDRICVSASGHAIAWDGRLDNRDDLAVRLGGDVRVRDGDAALALAAFERWGVDGLRHLIGDWSLAIWDDGDRVLHLARDYMGCRPLFYCIGPDYAAWSSHLGELASRTKQEDVLSDAFIAGFMSLQPSAGLTPYEQIRTVPTGSCVSLRAAGGASVTRFWTLTPATLRYRDRRMYEEHLRHLWREAVGARLRTGGTVWAELSGGLDSSSVVCMADLLVKGGHVPARSIRMVSHATLRSPEGDERRFIAEVERRVGVESEIVGVEDHQDHCDREWGWVTPYALQGVGVESVRRVRDGGGRLVLSGRMGDAIMGCQPDNSVAVFDDLDERRVLDALRNLRLWSLSTRKPFIELAWRLLARRVETTTDTGVALLSAALRERVSGDPHVQADLVGHFSRSKRNLASMVLAYAIGSRLDVPVQPPDVTYTYPFTHRPLVEFMLSIPGEELSAPGDTRSLMRRAFASFVPARILKRVSKGYYPPAAFRSARRLASSLQATDALEIVQRGWVDRDRLAYALRSLTDGGGESGGDIHCILRLETWLGARRDHLTIPQRKEVNTNAVLNA